MQLNDAKGAKSIRPVKVNKNRPSLNVTLKQLLVLVLALVTGIGTSRAIGDEAPGPTPAATPGTAPPLPYQVKVVTMGIVEIGQPILLGVYGPFAKDLKDALDKDAETARKTLKLYLDDVPIEGLPKAEVLPPEAAIALKSMDPKPSYVVRFVLNRDSNDDQNRKSWDTLLPQLKFGLQGLQVGVGLDGKIPHLSLGKDLQFQVRNPYLIGWVIGLGLVVFVIGMLGVILSGMVREKGANSPYSLGKTQMAFWGLLVAISFSAVAIIGHWMERIPNQVLILIGISGVTGLGSVVMNQREQSSNTSKGWFPDIISDGDGVSFQRFQVVLWTLILGALFAFNVANTCSMPEFENTLLVLMGISNGLYLGFKIPETKK